MSDSKKLKKINEKDDVCVDVEALQAKLAQAEKTAEENLNLAKYQKAEFENFKRRKAEAVADSLLEGRLNVILDVLPVLDMLQEGVKGIKNKDDREGFEVIIRKFNAILEGFNVKAYKSMGKPFDANLHNAIAAEPTEDKPPDTVIEEWQKGYKMGNDVIRVATVKISS